MGATRKGWHWAAGMMLCLATVVYAQVAGESGEKNRQAVQHRVVFELTDASPESWTALLNNIENVQKALGSGRMQVEAVAHGKALGLLMRKDNAQSERLAKIATTGVVFAACENTMRRQGVSREDLLPLARTVDSGVAEVIRKQEAGWSYIKSGI